jgi:predicted DNA-binding transcriptional regulator YafY
VPRVNAADRLRRVLAMVPWIAARDGPRIAEVCARFGCTEAELLEDLDLLFLCGLHPYTPDALIDVDVDGDRVWIRYADYFSRPLRLTAAEGMALVAAGNAVLATPGADPAGPLARGLAKVGKVLGPAAPAVDVTLGDAPPAILDVLRTANREHRQVDIEYYAFGRDEWSRRKVDPYAVFSAAGQWYLSAYCHAVDDERLFRVDRVRDAVVLDTFFEPPASMPDFTVYEPRPEDPRVVLELDDSARWVAEQYPVEDARDLAGGGLRVRLAVSERAWLERLLLRLGPRARVVEGDAGAGQAAACRLLARYVTK